MRMTAAKKAVSLLCLSLFVLLQALAVSPELHRFLHHDANKAEHQCAVTLLAQGRLNAAPVPVFVIVSPVLIFEIPAHPISAPVIVEYQLPPGRGPPAATLS